MRKIENREGWQRVMIAGSIFELRLSDGEVYRMGRETLKKCAVLDTSDPNAVLDALYAVCGAIDYMLGEGSVKKIVGDAPVSLPAALRIMNSIVKACSDRYAEYIRLEYTGGKQRAEVQLVKP